MESPLANPYATPASSLYGATSGGGSDAVAPGTIAQLAGTKPWVRFMSVLMWLLSGLLVLMSFSLAFVIAIGTFKTGPDAAFVNGLMIGTAVYYGVIAFIVIYPAFKLWKYASRTAQLMTSHSVTDLDAALHEQRRYWKFHGIMAIIAIGLAVIGGIIVFITAAMKTGVTPH
jgi:hypothetical protein